MKWIGGTVATPVLVGVLIWALQQPFASPAQPITVPSPSTSTPSQNPTEPPIAIDLVRVERVAEHGSWIFPQPMRLTVDELAQINKFDPYSKEAEQWFRRRGAVDLGAVEIKIVVRGNRDRPVRIIGMAVDKECGPPLQGTYFERPSAWMDDIVRVGFDLDAPGPRARTLDIGDQLGNDFFQEHTISLKPDEGVDEDAVFMVKAMTEKHYCDFSIVFEVLDRGRVIKHTVDDNIKPFKVSALHMRESGDYPGIDFSRYPVLYVSGIAKPVPHKSEGWESADPHEYHEGLGSG
ncbi:hypothetical protein [Sinosporangium siamense]|uniref:Uncharacterized protein n=1 Tax=Sinosporangium siamense TaxID=1367973 RepID=A0A919RLM3_9ACTN|nr:hypothetical protein [Sinosporangium siamense]GII95090.1 hypothetical protein Ssi02_53210 [Sinosporangium siamense]